MSCSIFIVDDEILFAEGLRALFKDCPTYNVIAVYDNGYEAIGNLAKYKPDIILIDFNNEEFTGMDVLRFVKERRLNINVVFTSFHDDMSFVRDAIELGCGGFVNKKESFDELCKALDYVMEGKQFIYQRLLESLNVFLARNDVKPYVTLTQRELEILKMITKGYLNKEIGVELNICERTVKNHVSNLFKKINVSDRTQAAVFAIKNNLTQI